MGVCGGVFEQLARYTMKYQEYDLRLDLYSSLTTANSPKNQSERLGVGNVLG